MKNKIKIKNLVYPFLLENCYRRMSLPWLKNYWYSNLRDGAMMAGVIDLILTVIISTIKLMMIKLLVADAQVVNAAYITVILILTVTVTINLLVLLAISNKWFGVMTVFSVLTAIAIGLSLPDLVFSLVTNAGDWVVWFRVLLLDLPSLMFKILFCDLLYKYRKR